MSTQQSENLERLIEVTADDLPLHCPTPSMLLWNAHPRVFLPVEKIVQRVEDILDQTEGTPGHIFNLGHGILPTTPVESAA